MNSETVYIERLRSLGRGLSRLRLLEETERLEGSLIEFHKAAWPEIDPAPYTSNWHLGAIAEHLEAVSYGQIRRIIINIPPRSSKTLLAGVSWQAWTWAQLYDPDYPLLGPQAKFMYLSYGDTLSLDTATTARRLIQSEWYQQRWGHRVKLRKDQEAKAKFDTFAGGTRISASFLGSVLGRGGDIRVIDDPHKVDEVESEDVRNRVLRTYDETIKSRVTDPQHTAEVIIMHRVHEADLTGHILAEADPGCVHLMLPAEYDSGRKCVTVLGWEDPRKVDGELLWPEKWGKEELAPYKKIPYLWAGQYLQNPVPRGGGIIKRDWWKVWNSTTYPKCTAIIAALDTAYTEKQENDASALTVWGVFQQQKEVEEPSFAVYPGLGIPKTMVKRSEPLSPKVILLYAWEGRVEFNSLVQTVASICAVDKNTKIKDTPQFPVDRLVIEAKANGISVGQELKRLYGNSGQFGIELVDPTKWGDKVSRMWSISHMFSDGMVYAPRDPESDEEYRWVEKTVNNVTSFPKAAHDDLADTVSLALRYLRVTGILQRADEFGAEQQELRTHKGRPRPLYPA